MSAGAPLQESLWIVRATRGEDQPYGYLTESGTWSERRRDARVFSRSREAEVAGIGARLPGMKNITAVRTVVRPHHEGEEW